MNETFSKKIKRKPYVINVIKLGGRWRGDQDAVPYPPIKWLWFSNVNTADTFMKSGLYPAAAKKAGDVVITCRFSCPHLPLSPPTEKTVNHPTVTGYAALCRLWWKLTQSKYNNEWESTSNCEAKLMNFFFNARIWQSACESDTKTRLSNDCAAMDACLMKPER